MGTFFYITESHKCGNQVNAEKPHFKKKIQVEESAMLGTRNIFASWLRRALLSKFHLDKKVFHLVVCELIPK